MFRIEEGAAQVLLAHPGGPYFQNKDDGAWTIPKGEPDADEDLLLTSTLAATRASWWRSDSAVAELLQVKVGEQSSIGIWMAAMMLHALMT
jgi:predicted NUDIX family NTP pyrophosphohydrolase